jgi:hypothetical protein
VGDVGYQGFHDSMEVWCMTGEDKTQTYNGRCRNCIRVGPLILKTKSTQRMSGDVCKMENVSLLPRNPINICVTNFISREYNSFWQKS